MKFLKEMAKLTRFEHALMLAFAVLLSEIIVLGSFPHLSQVLLYSLLVPVFSEMGSFAMNDCLDIETDKLNKRLERPLVKGTIGPKFAFHFSVFCLIISTFLAYFINFYAFLIAVIFNILAVLYNYKLKDLHLLGNIYIALSMAIPLIFGNFVVSGELNSFILLLSVLAFLSGLAREIIKSVEDMEGDKKARESNSYPLLVGKSNALLTSAFIYFLFLVCTFYLFTIIQNLFSQLLLIIIILYFLRNVIQLIQGREDKKFLEKCRKMSLIMLFLGLVSILVEVIF